MASEQSGNYSSLITDATIVNSIFHSANSVADKGVREALRSGVVAAVAALQERAGKDYHIDLEADAEAGSGR